VPTEEAGPPIDFYRDSDWAGAFVMAAPRRSEPSAIHEAAQASLIADSFHE